MPTGKSSQTLPYWQKLARFAGLELSYQSLFGHKVEAKVDSLKAALLCLGHEVEDSPEKLKAYHGELRRASLNRLSPVVQIFWDEFPTKWAMKIPEELSRQTLYVTLRKEKEDHYSQHFEAALSISLSLARCKTLKQVRQDGRNYVWKEISAKFKTSSGPTSHPMGYYQVEYRLKGVKETSFWIISPSRAYSHFDQVKKKRKRHWGTFVPLYSLWSNEHSDIGNFTSLEKLGKWASRLGGDLVGTLPLLALDLSETPSFNPSPYSPISRLFLNELFVDLSDHTNSIDTSGDSSDSDYIDYQSLISQKRRILNKRAKEFFKRPSTDPERKKYAAFLKGTPYLLPFARYMSYWEKFHSPPPFPPESPELERIWERKIHPDQVSYHLYAKWLAHHQLSGLNKKFARAKTGLYLDLPVGGGGQSFDTWFFTSNFLPKASVGAPPDQFFVHGQDWGLPPLHPERIRQDHYRYFRFMIREHLQYTQFLRIDHVQGLHRLYIIPHGLKPDQGVYLRYPAEEFYAILTLESHRYRTTLIGENLGTVPPEVNRMMKKRNVYGMYVLQFEIPVRKHQAMKRIGGHEVVYFNTHDMATFASFWRGKDLEYRHSTKALSSEELRTQKTKREFQLKFWIDLLKRHNLLREPINLDRIYRASLYYLQRSASPLLIFNLEDFWQEERPQNMPGTTNKEHPNWCRKTKYPLEDILNGIKAYPSLSESLRRPSQISISPRKGKPKGENS